MIEAFAEARDAEYSEVMERCREFHAELKKEREAGKFTFAELEENEEDLAKLEAWVGKIRARDRFGGTALAGGRAGTQLVPGRLGGLCRLRCMKRPTVARPIPDRLQSVRLEGGRHQAIGGRLRLWERPGLQPRPPDLPCRSTLSGQHSAGEGQRRL